MFCKILYRNVLPSSLNIGKSALQAHKRSLPINIFSQIVPVTLNLKAFTPHRLFSERASSVEMTVDYDYVNEATCKNDVLIVDVREADEVQEHGKIPNSINIPLGNVTKVLRTMTEKDFELIYDRPKPSEDTEIIFYCMIGKRSGSAQQDALSIGFKNAKNYLGSWTDWKTKAQ